MALNKRTGNMYEDVTHTKNYIKGFCPHKCTYCYVERIRKRFAKAVRSIFLDEKELKTNLGSGNFIFVGSSCDMWADSINGEWLYQILQHIEIYSENKYLFQTKNPKRLLEFREYLPQKCCIGTTIETNRNYPCMGESPWPDERAIAIKNISNVERFITIEPILDFDLNTFMDILRYANPDFIYIGADSGKNHLPEPPREKIIALITELEKFTIVHKKANLDRLLREAA
jgi:DNA repair photolyase